jgi:hypothetical protein
MALKRASNCPLCGAGLTAEEIIDAGSDLIEAHLGVVASCCPHCQGYLEFMPADGRLDVGYLTGPDKERFETALQLPLDGLVVERIALPPGLKLRAPGRSRDFRE